jgi:hypothetical protein
MSPCRRISAVRATANAILDGDAVKAVVVHQWIFWICCRNAVRPTRLTYDTGPSCKLSNIPRRHLTMVLPILIGKIWQCDRRDTLLKPQTKCFRFRPSTGHPRRRALKIEESSSSIATGTGRATFAKRITWSIRGPENEHPRKKYVNDSRHHANRHRASMVAEPAKNTRSG